MKLYLAAYPLALAAALLLARFELRTDDSGIVVLAVLLTTFILGCLHPRHAWQWALLSLVVPGSELFFKSSRPMPANTLNSFADYALLAAFMLALGLIGSYLGALAYRWLSPRYSLNR